MHDESMRTTRGRDRLRQLLDAVLDEDHERLDDMAGGAFACARYDVVGPLADSS